jgi:hypothetical protein
MAFRELRDEYGRLYYKGSISSDNKMHGYGCYYFYNLNDEDGDIYEGDFKDNQFSGYGIYKFSNIGIYKGKWSNNVQNGRGKFYYINGDVFDGIFKNSVREGFGTYRFKNGDVYEGNWKDDKYHGFGYLKTIEGKNDFSGEWNNGERVESLKIEQINSSVCLII